MNRFSFFCVLLTAALAASVTSAFSEEPVAVLRKHQVNCQVGLIIRSKPAYESKRLGSLEDGAKVTLAGKAVDGDKNKVIPVVSKDAQDAEVSWVQIAAPKAGYVLYKAVGAAPHDYLVQSK